MIRMLTILISIFIFTSSASASFESNECKLTNSDELYLISQEIGGLLALNNKINKITNRLRKKLNKKKLELVSLSDNNEAIWTNLYVFFGDGESVYDCASLNGSCSFADLSSNEMAISNLLSESDSILRKNTRIFKKHKLRHLVKIKNYTSKKARRLVKKAVNRLYKYNEFDYSSLLNSFNQYIEDFGVTRYESNCYES